MELNISHAGGWAPISSLGDKFTSPSFSGELVVGPDKYVSLDATGLFERDVSLLP